MDIGICSYSFHRLLGAGKQDIFRFILDCKELGCTQLDPWNGHMAGIHAGDKAIVGGGEPGTAKLSAEEIDYVAKVKAAGDAAGLPFGCVAVDGAHMCTTTKEEWRDNRARAYRWIEIAGRLGARQIRMDCGSTKEMPAGDFKVIVEGYKDVVPRAKAKGVEVVMENHWGASHYPDHVIKILEAVPGLGFLYDTQNWAEGLQMEGWTRTAKYAKAMHVKTFAFDAAGNETTQDIPKAIGLLKAAGYKGAWGVESVPNDGDEMSGARKTIALIRKCVGG